MKNYKVQYQATNSYDKRKGRTFTHYNCRTAISKKLLKEIGVTETENSITIEHDKDNNCLIIRKKTDE